jgi:hypothetical protein
MSEIKNKLIFAITTNLSAIPELTVAQDVELSLEPIGPIWLKELIKFSEAQGILSPAEIKQVRTQKNVIWGEYVFEGTGKTAAMKIAKLMKAYANLGSAVCYVENAMKVIPADLFKEIEIEDSIALLHLFVEIVREDGYVCSEGLEAFGLADLRVKPASEAAQATAFACAAQMICEGLELKVGDRFKATESLAEYIVSDLKFETATTEDEIKNSNGYLILEKSKTSVLKDKI